MIATERSMYEIINIQEILFFAFDIIDLVLFWHKL